MRTASPKLQALSLATSLVLTALSIPPLHAQVVPANPSIHSTDPGNKPLAFDAVSIREDKSIPDPQKNPMQFGPTPDGYHLKGLPINFMILAAYVPSGQAESSTYKPDQIKGLPAWATYTRYEVAAKVSQADLPGWKDPTQQRPMLRAMLQTMLADRFKLIVHRENEQQPIFELTLAKSGPRFTPSGAPALAEVREKHPGADVYENIGGIIVAATHEQTTYFNVTVSAFCSLMRAGRPIQDKTGLTGRYDITFTTPPPTPPGETPDPSQEVSTIMDRLGLKLTPAKGPVEVLVIDSIDRPSEN